MITITDPESAAIVARMHGGFSTPVIEAFRILWDARTSMRYGPLKEPLRTATINTLRWLYARKDDPQVQDERTRWEQRSAATIGAEPSELYELERQLAPLLWPQAYAAFHAGWYAGNGRQDRLDLIELLDAFVEYANPPEGEEG